MISPKQFNSPVHPLLCNIPMLLFRNKPKFSTWISQKEAMSLGQQLRNGLLKNISI